MSYVGNIRKAVFSQLDKNPLLTAKPLCKLIGLNYVQYGNYVKKLKHDWKCYHRVERGLICSLPDEVHNVFYRGRLPVGLVGFVLGELRGGRVGFWVLSRSRNRFWLFKSRLGRIRFFESGTVELFVRKPANLGKALQLFSDGFTRNYLITDIRVVDEFKAGLMMRCHATYKTGQRLPYKKITSFEDTHRFVFVSGDRTHPDCFEFMIEYHAEVEQARAFMDQLKEFFKSSGLNGAVKPLSRDYSV